MTDHKPIIVGSTDLCGKHLVNAEVCGCEPFTFITEPSTLDAEQLKAVLFPLVMPQPRDSAKPDSMSPHEIAKRMGWKIQTVPVYCCSCLADVTDAPHSTHECKPRGGFEFL